MQNIIKLHFGIVVDFERIHRELWRDNLKQKAALVINRDNWAKTINSI